VKSQRKRGAGEGRAVNGDLWSKKPCLHPIPQQGRDTARDFFFFPLFFFYLFLFSVPRIDRQVAEREGAGAFGEVLLPGPAGPRRAGRISFFPFRRTRILEQGGTRN